ncbi:hypothetical protein A3C87_03240 [Candidatus Kaiserbacteria bacterium RIFCSPHIGHO2_02_FULL_49_34]|uniref:Zeta toxin domain-containing protein n=1 Tax=Candidatus Kaiserbacteria bacterium RIFCSPHIGHO2_02_FULL_49_34 TaxID=1798491 RepID=A0A1F6DII8_9BACT|nr:MAG: hypothetical protein A3C87_03240 [Candidatus Kaiserbacteria bacterium RIFCSPHIGHO2_02_FULL_49_34]
MLTPDEQKICDAAIEYVKTQKSQLVERYASLDVVKPDTNPVSVFMAGSPGAGKTEFSLRLLQQIKTSDINVVRIDPDELRKGMPGYGGGNAHVFQLPVTKLVHELHASLLKNKQSFLLDGTLSNYATAKQNVERSLKRGRSVYVYYVYQDPLQAWKFTQAREKQEGRRIMKETFITQYFSAKDTVNALKTEFGDRIVVHLVVKNSDHEIIMFEKNIRSIDSHLKVKYSKESLEGAIR